MTTRVLGYVGKSYLLVPVTAFTREGWAGITNCVDHVSDRGTPGLAVLRKLTRDFCPAFSPSCVAEASRSGEGLQVCLGCPRLNQIKVTQKLETAIWSQEVILIYDLVSGRLTVIKRELRVPMARLFSPIGWRQREPPRKIRKPFFSFYVEMNLLLQLRNHFVLIYSWSHLKFQLLDIGKSKWAIMVIHKNDKSIFVSFAIKKIMIKWWFQWIESTTKQAAWWVLHVIFCSLLRNWIIFGLAVNKKIIVIPRDPDSNGSFFLLVKI